MPTYDYECGHCKHRFEAFHAISAEPLTKCPRCGRKRLRRRIGPGAGVIFKGSGFYGTDYVRKGSAGPKGTEPKPAPDTKASGTAGEGGGTD